MRQELKLAALEQRALDGLATAFDDIPVVRLPRLSDAVHDASRLIELLPWLVGSLVNESAAMGTGDERH